MVAKRGLDIVEEHRLAQENLALAQEQLLRLRESSDNVHIWPPMRVDTKCRAGGETVHKTSRATRAVDRNSPPARFDSAPMRPWTREWRMDCTASCALRFELRDA